MTGRIWLRRAAIAVGAALAVAAAPDFAAAQDRRLAVGLIAHDRGPFSDRHEDGIDLNLELQLSPPGLDLWRDIGGPRPHAGLTLNSQGDTNAAYAGLTYDLLSLGKLTLQGAVGLAVHDGPLHKADRERCRLESDCGFGSRVLFRGALELALEVAADRAVSLFFDHMSQYEILADENEGIDNVGLRYTLRF